MKSIFEKIGISILKGVIVFLGAIILIDVFIVVNELLGNEDVVEKMDKFIINIINN